MNTEERLENAIRHQPHRYVVTRDKEGKLTEVIDNDTGRLWLPVRNRKYWVWID